MQRPRMSHPIAIAAAWDAATAHARKHGRKQWTAEDYNVAVETFNRLYPPSAAHADAAEAAEIDALDTLATEA